VSHPADFAGSFFGSLRQGVLGHLIQQLPASSVEADDASAPSCHKRRPIKPLEQFCSPPRSSHTRKGSSKATKMRIACNWQYFSTKQFVSVYLLDTCGGNRILKATAPMKKCLIILSFCLLGARARGEVRVFVQELGGAACIKYECTGGEVVRAFALNVSVDKGQIIGLSDFFRGESTAGARGYGIFPASFRDHIAVGSGTNIDWNVTDYTPLAVVADRPADTMPGLNSSGVTLEFGGLWDAAVPAAVPPSVGTLCALQLSQAANVSVAANVSRGGVMPSSPDITFTPTFTGAFVDPVFPAITGLTLTNGVMTISFIGGELASAETLPSGWVGTGQTNGVYAQPVGEAASRFYRVRHR